MVPKGWEQNTLSGIVKEKISYGIVQAGPHIDDGVPYIKSSDVRGGINPNQLQRTSHDIHHKYRRSAVHPGDIVFSLRGNIGEAAIVPSELKEANLTQGTARISVSNEHDSLFHYYQVTSTSILNHVNALSKGSTFKEISLEELRKVRVLCPPLAEQKKIAQILSNWDQAIATTERLLDLAQQQKKALMQQLLTGKKRFPGFEGEWKAVKLGSIFSRVTTRNDGQSENVVTISGQQGLIRQDEYFNRTVASETLDNYFLLKKGQFAYNKSYSISYPMGAIKRLNRYDDGVVTTLYICFALAAKDKADSNFFEHYFESGLLNRGLTQIAHEGGRAHGLLNVKPADFFDLKVPLPVLAEQVKIAATLTSADQEIQALQSQLDGLKQEKKALMQQLLTGKRRVQCALDEAEA
ncbi:restriction endonuclease subunit S [Chromobacterium sphagni]|uniref:Restriction endonuclease subunit S n=1 Tax=Chromobacterium sphagni TaxID=1903179 RepID=A0A1S1X1Q0_9NEIS|nr:restriction endonuclease subunit S [Chromobacterium sphagni]OHX13452.1 restriction endonuclease subunit S [Chromobacterium sphagni]